MKNKRNHSEPPDRELFEKYLQGKMSPEEAYQFERQVLQDPFYQDAMDGLESLDPEDADQDLDLLSQKIRGRSGWLRVRPVYHYRIAAAIAILAVFTYFIFQTISRIEKASAPEAVTQRVAEPEEVPGEEAMRAEENRLPVETGDRPEAGPESEKVETDLSIQEPKAAADRTGADADMEPQEAATIVTEKKSVAETSETMTSDPDRTVPDIELMADEGIRREEAEEIPDMEIAAIPVSERTAITEKETMELDVQQIEAAGKDTAGDMEVAAAPIASDADLPEARKRDKAQNGRSDAGPKRSPAAPVALRESVPSTEPVIGFEAYTLYIKENLRYPEVEAETGLEGIVEIRFTVDKDSLPSNFQVIRSLSRDCDLEAIRLLKEGPAWKPLYDASGRLQESGVSYRIEFKLKE